MILQALHLRKAFATTVAVNNVSLEVRPGRILGLLGPNGAGKTTTIRMILNILRPDEGTILYDGEKFSDSVRGQIGYLPEERGLYRKSRVLDIILYFGELRGLSRSAVRESGLKWLDRFGLAGESGRKLEELSKGNQQKVQFIASVVHNPSLLVLDEPFSGFDPLNQELLKEILLELRGGGTSLVFSTHQMEQAEQMSEDLCLINRGEVVLSGTVPEIRSRYGTNALQIEFTGDGSILRGLTGVASVSLFARSAELVLKEGTKPQAILEQLLGKLEIRSFQLVEPTLRAVFMDAVARQPEGTAG